MALFRGEGVTEAERHLKKLCDHTFLTLWCYPAPFRDQGQTGHDSDGKEICDLLVLFQDHIIIFSDKACEFPESDNLDIDWARWYRRAISDSAKQIWGAERWLRTHPDRVFLDRACTQRLHVDIPDFATAKVHRIVVAHGATARCRATYGGSGSLLINPSILGDAHIRRSEEGGTPFAIGQIAPDKGYIHVFDDASLDKVLQSRDTISDFVEYLIKKEIFVTSGRLAVAEGEENLLAYYLMDVDENMEHDFVVQETATPVTIKRGLWEKFTRSPEYSAQSEANQDSYKWDQLIEYFTELILGEELYYASHPDVRDQARYLTLFAQESRLQRRVLIDALIEHIRRTPKNIRNARIIKALSPGATYYIFVLFPIPAGMTYEQYRIARRNVLLAYCMVTKLVCPDATHIVGLGFEPADHDGSSEDVIYYDAREWDEHDKQEAEQARDLFQILQEPVQTERRIEEYPVPVNEEVQRLVRISSPLPKNPRNKPCPCGSGLKYKRCCGK